MSDVVKAKCPHCQNVLRLPVAWLGQSLRCKHCQKVVLLKPKPTSPPTAPAAKKGINSNARPAQPRPPAGPSPFAFDALPDEPAPVRRRSGDRRPGSTLWKGALLAACVVAVVAVLGVLLGPSLLGP